MRLAVVVEQLLAPTPGGTGRYARELAAALAAPPEAGADPGADPGARPGARPGVDEVTGWCAWHRNLSGARIPGVRGPRRLPVGRRALALAWERGRGPSPDGPVVVAPTVLAPPRRRGQLLLAVVHDTVPYSHPETLTRRGVAFHRRCIERLAAEADAILVPTAAVARELAQVVVLDPARLHVVGAGVSAAVAIPPPDAVARRERLGLPRSGYLLTLATLEPRKGLDVALAALAGLPQAPPLVIAGAPGWGGVDLAAMAARLDLPPGRVREVGRLSDPDLAATLAGARALLAPSRAEGFGLPVVEAMAHGVPVIASDAPALVEVAGGAARHVPVGDAEALAAAVTELLADPVAARELGERGRERSAAFRWDRIAGVVRGLAAQLAPR